MDKQYTIEIDLNVDGGYEDVGGIKKWVDGKVWYTVKHVTMDAITHDKIVNALLEDSIASQLYERKRILALRKPEEEPPTEEEIREVGAKKYAYTKLLRQEVGNLIVSFTYEGKEYMVDKVEDIKDVRIIDALARQVVPKGV